MHVKGFGSCKVTMIERHDMLTPCRDRQFENHVVVQIWQPRTPEKKDRLFVRHAAEVVKQAAHVSVSNGKVGQLAKENTLILEHKRD